MFKKKLVFLSVFLYIFSIAITGKADGQSYSVKPILPSNQDAGISNYISITPNKDSLKQEVEFLVTNKTKEPKEIRIKPVNALTSPNGVIQYSPNIDEENAKLIDKIYSMPKYAEVEKKISLDAGESKVIKANVDISNVDGTILGGIAFQALEEGEIQQKDDVQFKINNEMNTVIGMLVNFESDDKPKFEIGEPFVDPMPAYYAVRLPITFDSALLLKGVSLDYEMLFEGNKLFFSKLELDFAPKTKTNFAIPWEHDTIEKGKTYVLKGTLSYQNKTGEKEIIPFEKEFQFTNDEQSGLSIKERMIPDVKGLSYWLLLLLLIPLFLLLAYLYKRKKGVFVLYSNDTPIFIIEKTNEDFEKLQPIKQAINNNGYRFAHHYMRKKNKQNEAYYYAYHRTKKQ